MQKQIAGAYGGSRPTVANYAVNSEELKSVLQATRRKTKSFRRTIFSIPVNESPQMGQCQPFDVYILNIYSFQYHQ